MACADIDLNKVQSTDFIDTDALVEAFKKYTMAELGYDEFGAEIAASDMKDPYNAPYIVQEYEGDYTIGGKAYSVRECKTDFMRCGLYELANVTPFEFYMLIDLDTLENQTVGAYTKAKKLYIYKEDTTEPVELVFRVTITGDDYEGTVNVSSKVRAGELRYLKECIENEGSIEEYYGLDDLYERVTDEAIDDFNAERYLNGGEEIEWFDDADFEVELISEI